MLRWNEPPATPAAASIPPRLQPSPPFLGTGRPGRHRPSSPQSAFSEAHLGGTRQVGWRLPSTLPVEVRRLLPGGERFVYAYYDSIDKVAHEYGLGEHYDAELAPPTVWSADCSRRCPTERRAAGDGRSRTGRRRRRVCRSTPTCCRSCALQSGEARFRWLHARRGAAGELQAAAAAATAPTRGCVTASS